MGMRIHSRCSGSRRRVLRLERAAQTSGVAMLPWAGVAADRPESAWRDEEVGEARQASSEVFGVTRPLLQVDLRSGRGGESPLEPWLEACTLASLSPVAGGEKAGFRSCHTLGYSRHCTGQQSRSGVGPGLVRGGQTAATSGVAVVVSRGGVRHGSRQCGIGAAEALVFGAAGRDVPTAPKTQTKTDYVCLFIR